MILMLAIKGILDMAFAFLFVLTHQCIIQNRGRYVCITGAVYT